MRFPVRYERMALLFAGSAVLLLSCVKEHPPEAVSQVQMTEYSENLSVITSENGQKSYHFTAPLMEGYTLAREPYREFRKGVKIVTYEKDDTLSAVDATLTANYAIYYEKRELWEAKGNVVIIKEDGKRLYTQQLFWNATTKRIYSNVDTRIVDGVDNFIGEGFESDDELRKWKFRRMKGRMTVEMTPAGEPADQIPLAPRPLEEEERAGRLLPLGGQDDAATPTPAAETSLPPVGRQSADSLPAGGSHAAEESADAAGPVADGDAASGAAGGEMARPNGAAALPAAGSAPDESSAAPMHTADTPSSERINPAAARPTGGGVTASESGAAAQPEPSAASGNAASVRPQTES